MSRFVSGLCLRSTWAIRVDLRSCEVVSKADCMKWQPSALLIQSLEEVQDLRGRC